MTPAAKRTEDSTLRALPPHLTRPPKHKRRATHPRSRPSSPLSLPPLSSPDPEKCEDPDLGTTCGVTETEVTSPVSSVYQKTSALEEKTDAMQTRMNAVGKETEALKERVSSSMRSTNSSSYLRPYCSHT